MKTWYLMYQTYSEAGEGSTPTESICQEWKVEGQHTPPQRETGRSHEERGGRRRRRLLLQTAGAGEAGRSGTTPPSASHTSDSTGRLSHTPSQTHTAGGGGRRKRRRRNKGEERHLSGTGSRRETYQIHFCISHEGGREGEETEYGNTKLTGGEGGGGPVYSTLIYILFLLY